MAPMSLFEKIDKLITTMNTTTLLLMLVSIVLVSVMFIFSETNKKYSYISYILVLVFVGFAFKNSLFRLTDMFIERLFYLFYFPTGAIYMITLVVSHVVFLTSLGNKKIDKTIKNINFIGFGLMQVLCINILSYLSTSNLDLTNELNFVNDYTMIGILELSMMVFSAWMGIVVVKTVINKLTRTVLANEIIEEEETPEVVKTPVFAPAFANMTKSISEKWNQLKEAKPSLPEFKQPRMANIVEEAKEPVVYDNVLETPQPVYTTNITVEEEKPKMTQELMDRLLRPEPMMMKEEPLKVAETKQTTTVSVQKEASISWSNAVIEALHIPSEPIYNDIEEPFMNRIVETVPEEVQSEPEEEKMAPSTNIEKKNTSNVVDLCQLLLRKQEDPGHSLEDYLELKKYLMASK